MESAPPLGVIDNKLWRRLKISQVTTGCSFVYSCVNHSESAGWWPPCGEEGNCRLSTVSEQKPPKTGICGWCMNFLVVGLGLVWKKLDFAR
jgi:hypothetical protein